MKVIHTVTHVAKDAVWIAKKFQPIWGGVLVVDGKGVKVFESLAKSLKHRGMSSQEYKRLHRKVWICGIDYLTGDLPHYTLADEETKVDLVMYFKILKEEIHYELKVLVCDGNEDIVLAARKVYGETFLVQRCTR
ncbi:MAG: hypothetical protein NUW00_03435, partial [Candidatus Kaiserbacteria bacterium]|nr:hypothetical protein [Candidatus Kaiserbacteria bacterium]